MATNEKLDLASQSFKRTPWLTMQPWRDRGPIIQGRLPFFGPCWFVLSYDAAQEVLRDQERFARDSANAGRGSFAGIRWWMPRNLALLANNMLAYDADDHRRLRSLVDVAFMRRSVEGMRNQIENLVSQHLDFCEAQFSQSGKRSVDLVPHLARPLPLAVICELLGIPDSDRDQFSRWAEAALSVTNLWGMFRALPNLKKMVRYAREQIESVRRKPRSGLLTALVEAESEGHSLSEDELVAMVFLLLVAGHETTVHLLSGGILALLDFPDQRKKLRDNSQLANATVTEVLRYTSPVQMTKPRFATRDLPNFYGRHIARGESIVPLIAAANCDPNQFSRPNDFLIERDERSNLAFGSGVHFCVGKKLAIAEAEITFRQLVERWPELALSSESTTLKFHKRIGMRALMQLPVDLGTRC